MPEAIKFNCQQLLKKDKIRTYKENDLGCFHSINVHTVKLHDTECTKCIIHFI